MRTRVFAVSSLLLTTLACGDAPRTSDRADPSTTDSATGRSVHVVEGKDLRARGALDPLVIDLPSGDTWVVKADAVPFLEHGLVVCPDGNTRMLDAWAHAESARSNVDIDDGFIVTTDGAPQPLQQCDTTCTQCPDGALMCTTTCDNPDPANLDNSEAAQTQDGHASGSGTGGGDDDGTQGGSSGGSSGGSTGGGGESNSTGSAGSTNHGGVGGGGGSGGGRGDW